MRVLERPKSDQIVVNAEQFGLIEILYYIQAVVLNRNCADSWRAEEKHMSGEMNQ